MRTASDRWMKKTAFVLALTVILGGLYGGAMPRTASAATPKVELPTEPEKQVGAGVEISSTGTDRFQVVFNGQYDPQSNPKGYTGSAIMLPSTLR